MEADKKNIYILIVIKKKRKNNGEKVFRVTLTRESETFFKFRGNSSNINLAHNVLLDRP